ncbi:M20 family metallopeptidase [Candidatus Uhrbacteria bacterium]|nr:M20 family metallopeptidase [Candidatus Uhrbacteria bacterium]
MGQDPVLSILDELCQKRGFRKEKGGPGELGIAELLAAKLREFPWLTVWIEEVHDEKGNVCPGFYNVLAFDGDPSETRFLVVGHLDTVAPATGWSRDEYTVDDGKYFALGAADTRSGIAACLNAIGKADATRGVGYLFYSDEEVGFLGMKDFVRRHREVAPTHGLSLCGGYGIAQTGWRGCSEMEFLLEGVAGHASRPWEGANAASAASVVMDAVRAALISFDGKEKTAANVAAIHAGTLSPPKWKNKKRYRYPRDYRMGEQVPPPIKNVANKIPNVAWALLDFRPGDSAVTCAMVERVAREALAAWNDGRAHQVSLVVHTNFEMPAYLADPEKVRWLVDAFEPVHGGVSSAPGATGFIDVTLIAARHGTQFLCLSPKGGPAHGPDEHVEILSLVAYRDCVVGLLRGYARL